MSVTNLEPTRASVVSTAHLDDAHVGDIVGALGTIRRHQANPIGWRKRLLALVAIMGPGLVVMVGDNDAGGVATYAQAGQNYPQPAGLPMPRATTAAWLTRPPRDVRMPSAAIIPWRSSGDVSGRTRMTNGVRFTTPPLGSRFQLPAATTCANASSMPTP